VAAKRVNVEVVPFDGTTLHELGRCYNWAKF